MRSVNFHKKKSPHWQN